MTKDANKEPLSGSEKVERAADGLNENHISKIKDAVRSVMGAERAEMYAESEHCS